MLLITHVSESFFKISGPFFIKCLFVLSTFLKYLCFHVNVEDLWYLFYALQNKRLSRLMFSCGTSFVSMPREGFPTRNQTRREGRPGFVVTRHNLMSWCCISLCVWHRASGLFSRLYLNVGGVGWTGGLRLQTIMFKINNKVLLYSTENYIQSPGIDHDGKEY